MNQNLVIKNIKSKNILASISILIFLLLLSSCTPQASGKRKPSKQNQDTTIKEPTKDPSFSDSITYFQVGNTNYKTSVHLDLNYNDYIQLRGKNVHNYIKLNNMSNPICLITKFQDAGINHYTITTALPRNVVNYQEGTLEYYYSLATNAETQNRNFCQRSSIISHINTMDTTNTKTINYKSTGICPSGTCNFPSITSSEIQLVSIDAINITNISVNHLYFILNNSNTPTTPGSNTCSNSTQCNSLGFDCCSSGICVDDLTVKNSTDTTSNDYLQALNDIIRNPSAIYNYPQYYNICSQPVQNPSNPKDDEAPSDDTIAKERIEKLSALYSCTNKILGEMGICEARFNDVEIGNTYYVNADDTNFRSTLSNHLISPEALSSVESVIYGGVELFHASRLNLSQSHLNTYSDYTNPLDPNSKHITLENFLQDDRNLAKAQVTIFKKPSNAKNNTLIIRYRIDASCTLLNSNTARCEKYYKQDENSVDLTPSSLVHRDSNEIITRKAITNHYPSSNLFTLPPFADTSRTISVEIDGITQRIESDWRLNTTAPASIEFINTPNLKAFRGQTVKITYLVNISNSSNFMKSKLDAQNEINKVCSCQGSMQCSLTPVKNSVNTVTDYACVYPQLETVIAPEEQVAYLSSKSIPVRFFDQSGISHKSAADSIYPQEGKEFSYHLNNLLKPNNVPDDLNGADLTNYYVGFNEIYGSINTKLNAAKPPLELNVKKGQSYDIYITGGAVSNCIQCGNDYYSHLTRMFPLTNFAGGAKPHLSPTNRIAQTNDSIRSDDLKFGRACLIPASMIPWTHSVKTDAQSQRQDRMYSQHFLYANGYQYDWYGFDYGAVIGSFDGVKWFAIGTNRRIQADTNKLFIAVNAPMGDQTIESTFRVEVKNSNLNPFETNLVTKDIDSDAAQCQQYHMCSTDNDCATTLGWEYSCMNVTTLNSPWPVFDHNANEIPEMQREDMRLSSILGITSSPKRCVYRGRGAQCLPNPSLNTANYAQTTEVGALTCASGNYCQSMFNNGQPVAKFNNRIYRTAKSITTTDRDTFGLAVKLPGRPFEFNATETPNITTLNNLLYNGSSNICIPGQNVDASTFALQNSQAPIDDNHLGDRVLGIGITQTADYGTSLQALSACSVIDANKNFYRNDQSRTPADIALDAGTQNISTNSLQIFKDILETKGINLSIYKGNDNILNSISFTEARCLRAPGASCFSDLDCAPSKTISDKLSAINANDSSLYSLINKHEINFWKENLVCSQSIPKESSSYDPKNNRCCREVGKTLNIATSDISNQLTYTEVAGIDQSYNDPKRYSRAATIYNKTSGSNPTLKDLSAAVKNQCTGAGCKDISSLAKQYKTLSTLGSLTSCTGNWVRNFATPGNRWEVSKFQTLNSGRFKCYNWLPQSVTPGSTYTPEDDGSYGCANYGENSPYCPVVQTTPSSYKAQQILDFFAKFELLGIPQIAIETPTQFTATQGFLTCLSHPDGRKLSTHPYPPASPTSSYQIPKDIFPPTLSPAEYTNGANTFYAANDAENFASSFKQIFSAEEFRTCYPAGTVLEQGADANLCCSGMINAEKQMCQVSDFVDISVYTNRYVSSEAQNLSEAFFDDNGYIKDVSQLAVLACQKQICASGAMAKGVLISNLPIPGLGDSAEKILRFLENNSTDDNKNGLLDLYNKGLKFNNHLYCIPKELADNQNASNDLTIYNCEN